ncbi:MAG: 6-bladed beta-propeller [Elusimicrobiota bacterium]
MRKILIFVFTINFLISWFFNFHLFAGIFADDEWGGISFGWINAIKKEIKELDKQIFLEFVTKWGTRGTGDGQFDRPTGVAVDSSGNVYVVDTGNFRIQKFNSNGIFILKWGSQGSGDGQFTGPQGITVDKSDNIYITDNNQVKKFSSNGTFITKWGSYGWADGQFTNPIGIALDSSGSVYVADTGNHRIQKFSSNGTFILKWGNQGTSDGSFNLAFGGIAIDAFDNIYVTDTWNDRIQKFTSNGIFILKWERGHPRYIAVDLTGNVLTTGGNNKIEKYTSNGKFIAEFGTAGGENGQFLCISGIAIDSYGNVYIADTDNHRIQKFRPR